MTDACYIVRNYEIYYLCAATKRTLSYACYIAGNNDVLKT